MKQSTFLLFYTYCTNAFCYQGLDKNNYLAESGKNCTG